MRTSLLLSVVSCLFAACGGGSSGGPGAGAHSSDFLIRDAPPDHLLSFSARVEQMHLLSTGGEMTPNLLTRPVTLEMTSLHSNMCWLASTSVPAGTWSAVRVSLDPASIEARGMGGALVPVNVTSSVLTAHLNSPVTVGSSGYRRWVVDLDLAASLTGSVAAPPLNFGAHGTAFCDAGGPSFEIGDVRGLVQSVDAAGSSLVMSAWVDGDCTLPIGPIAVSVPPGTQLVGSDGSILASDAFFSALQSGLTVLEVHGQHTQAGVHATRIRIADQHGGTGTQSEVQIDGMVAAVGPGSTFSLLMQHIEKGAWIAAPALASLGDPASITVGYDQATLFLFGHSGAGNPGMLAVGERVAVRFPAFDNPPFYGSCVEIDGAPGFECSVVSTAGLPSSMVVHVAPDSLAITAGQVASSNTNVTVLLPGSNWHLGVGMGVDIQGGEILSGVNVRVHGFISGPPSGPTIDATQQDCEVHPGRCQGTVEPGMMGGSTFDCSGLEILDPFGGSSGPGPYSVEIAPGCWFHGSASSESDFFEQCGGMSGGHHMQVRVVGIGTGTQGQVQAFELETVLQ